MTKAAPLDAQHRFARHAKDPAHGTESGYSYWKCRCARCRRAWADVSKSRNRASRERLRKSTILPEDAVELENVIFYGFPLSPALADKIRGLAERATQKEK